MGKELLLLHGERQGDTVRRVYGTGDVVDAITENTTSPTFAKSNCHTHKFGKMRKSSGEQRLILTSQREQMRLQKSLN